MPTPLKKTSAPKRNHMEKCPTGIKGFDQVTEGGLPKNRTTLISGGLARAKLFWDLIF